MQQGSLSAVLACCSLCPSVQITFEMFVRFQSEPRLFNIHSKVKKKGQKYVLKQLPPLVSQLSFLWGVGWGGLEYQASKYCLLTKQMKKISSITYKAGHFDNGLVTQKKRYEPVPKVRLE